MSSVVCSSVTLDSATGAVTGGGLAGQVLFNAGIVPGPGTAAGGQTAYGRGIVLVAVSAGTIKVANSGAWQPVTNGTTAFSTSVSVIRSAVNNGRIWFVDGANWKYYDSITNSVLPWVASAGSLPIDNSGNLPRLICTWRGRTVVSGHKDDPYNFFMSAVSDPTNWDYSPLSTTPTQAVAGNLSPLGLIGDVITNLIPYSDDVLIVGTDHQIWLIQGDPMAGGQAALTSDAIGMAFGGAWCKDPFGTVYFMTNLGLMYSMVPGQAPQHISQSIQGLLQGLAVDNVIVRMMWSETENGLHVFVTHYASAQADTHYFWEQRTGAWWQQVFANNNHNPMCCLAYQGNTATDRVGLVGSWDGYVRYFSSSATTDDGTAIASAVVMGPLLTSDMDYLLCKDVQAEMATGSGDVTYGIYVGETAEGALVSTAAVTGTWTSGRNFTNYVRRAGYALYVRIDATVPWAMERVRCRIASKGKVERRGRAR